MGGELTTGVETLDRQLGGGLSAGDVLAIVAPPTAQTQTLIYQLMRERPTVYMTTLRPGSSIERDITNRGEFGLSYQVVDVESRVSMESDAMQKLTGSRAYTTNTALKQSPLDDIYETVNSIDEPTNAVIDPTNPVERGDQRQLYTEVLNQLSVKMQETGGLGVLHCRSTNSPPPYRDETLMIADVVWEVDVNSTTKDNIEYKLRMPKNRSGDVMSEELTLELGHRDISVDDSRAI